MIGSTFFIILTIVILLIISIFLLVINKNKGGKTKPLTPVAGLAFGCILMGVIFGEDRLIGYGLVGIGVLLAIVDVIIKLRRKL